MKVIPNAIQSFLLSAGNAACYALDIIKLAENFTGKEIPILDALYNGIESDMIDFDYTNYASEDNFFVRDPAKFLGLLTGKKWTVKKEHIGYIPSYDEMVIQCWTRSVGNTTYTHFRLPEWDSLANSQTVSKGKLTSLRVFSLVK